MTRKLFGTDGIRGTANKYPLTCELALDIGRAAAKIFKKSVKNKNKNKCMIIIGRDTRISGSMLENAIAAGICSEGVDAIKAGIMTTPALAFTLEKKKAAAGIMISASHNPFEDNGIKIFAGNGFKLSDAQEEEIEDMIFNFNKREPEVMPSEIGRVYDINASEDYINHITETFPKNLSLSGLKIFIDCANGAGYDVAEKIFEKLGASVTAINDSPDGININRECGATNTKMLCKAVTGNGADIGIALDGDADRLIVVDEKGNTVDGDKIMALCAVDLMKRGKLKDNTLVATVMSNVGLDIAMNNAGIKVVKTSVGDRYVLEEMLKNNYNFGGEQSGHMIFLDYTKTGDGILSAVQVLAVMKKSKRKISELSGVMEKLPQVLINVKIKRKEDMNLIPEIKNSILDAEKELSGRGRVLVRFSGTENLCRVMVESSSDELANKSAKRIADAVERNLN